MVTELIEFDLKKLAILWRDDISHLVSHTNPSKNTIEVTLSRIKIAGDNLN